MLSQSNLNVGDSAHLTVARDLMFRLKSTAKSVDPTVNFDDRLNGSDFYSVMSTKNVSSKAYFMHKKVVKHSIKNSHAMHLKPYHNRQLPKMSIQIVIVVTR